MGENFNHCSAKVSFHELFGEEEASVDKLNSFLNSVVDLKNETHSVSSSTLIKIIHNGEILWLTQAQADSYLQQQVIHSGESELRAAVERALKGETKAVKQELSVLLTMAQITIDECKNDPNVDQVEIRRLIPVVKRTQSEIMQIVEDIGELEDHVAKVRQEQPDIRAYEAKVGDLMAKKSEGDWDEAKRIAEELLKKKQYYLLCCRSVEPDIRAIYSRRLDLQKVKKRLISMHRYLCTQKVDGLEHEISELKERIRSIREHSNENIVDEMKSKPVSKEELDRLTKQLQQERSALLSMSREDKIYKQKESDTQSVINEIANNVLKKPELDISEQITALNGRQRLKQKPSASASKSTARMVIMERKK